MNRSIIKSLILKDWDFNKYTIFLFTGIGLISVYLVSLESKAAFYIGLVILISIVICIGALLIFSTVVNERKNQNLPFIMSLPITNVDYTKAKLLSNISVYTLSWLLLAAGTLGVIAFNEHLPNGLIPAAVIILVELMVAYLLVLGVALVTESEQWTTVVMAITNVGVSVFMFFIITLEGIGSHMESSVAVWNPTAVTILVIEGVIATLIIGMTFYLQSRKTDFI